MTATLKRRREDTSFWLKNFNLLLSTILLLGTLGAAAYTYVAHVDDVKSHFVNGEKKIYTEHMAQADDHSLTVDEKGKVINHLSDESVHMPLESKLDMFFTRREANQLTKTIEQLHKSVEKLSDKIDKLPK